MPVLSNLDMGVVPTENIFEKDIYGKFDGDASQIILNSLCPRA